MTAGRVLAAGLAIGVALLNLAVEHVLTGARGSLVLVPGFLDYSPTWNRGVSFGLFSQNGGTGPLVLMAMLACVAAFVGYMAWRSTSRLQAAGYGLVVGGALGNLADRAFSGGAVFDYLFLHLGQISLFVFNFSDAVISAGAVLVMTDALLSPREARADS